MRASPALVAATTATPGKKPKTAPESKPKVKDHPTKYPGNHLGDGIVETDFVVQNDLSLTKRGLQQGSKSICLSLPTHSLDHPIDQRKRKGFASWMYLFPLPRPYILTNHRKKNPVLMAVLISSDDCASSEVIDSAPLGLGHVGLFPWPRCKTISNGEDVGVGIGQTG